MTIGRVVAATGLVLSIGVAAEAQCAGGSCPTPGAVGGFPALPSGLGGPVWAPPPPLLLPPPVVVPPPPPLAVSRVEPAPPLRVFAARESVIVVSTRAATPGGGAGLAAVNKLRTAIGLAALEYDSRCDQAARDNNRAQRDQGVGHYVQEHEQCVAGNVGDVDEALGAWLLKPRSRELILSPAIRYGACRLDRGYATFEAR